MTPEFNAWWDDDLLTQTNPYREGSPIYWAWEGWYHGVKQEREACARVCEAQRDARIETHPARVEYSDNAMALRCAAAIRARGEK